MSECHQCKGNRPFFSRSGGCSYCLQTKVKFCADCAFWELGPPKAANGLPRWLRRPQMQTGLVAACPIKTQQRTDNIADIRLRCQLIESQFAAPPVLHTIAFPTLVDSAIALYDEYYEATAPFDRKAMHTFITAYLSAQERCRNRCGNATRTIQAHDAPRLAAKHLETCFFVDNLIPAPLRQKMKAAARLETVELLTKNKISFALAREQILTAAANNLADAQEILQLSIILYHAWTGVRPADQHHGQFDPVASHGLMSPEHRLALYGNAPAAPPRFTAAIDTQLGTLYASLALVPPADPRWPDLDVQNAENGNLINPQQARYLQWLPKFDTPAINAANRSRCELWVRAKVTDRLKKLFRTSARYALPPDPPLLWNDAIVDALVADLRNDFVIETVCSDGLMDRVNAQQILNNDVNLRAFALGLKVNVNWNTILHPACNAVGQFVGMDHHPNDFLAGGYTDGRQLDGARENYLPWRNDKDQFLYDMFPLSALDDLGIDDRPNFTSLSVSPDLPEIKAQYGKHIIVWRNDLLHRSPLTFGDLGHPRRSFLLLLRDLLYPIPRKDGSATLLPRGRLTVLANIIHRHLNQNRTLWDQPNFTAFMQRRDNKVNRNDFGNIEVHVFGSLSIARDAEHLAICLTGGDRTLIDSLALHRLPNSNWDLVEHDNVDLLARDALRGNQAAKSPLDNTFGGEPAEDTQIQNLS